MIFVACGYSGTGSSAIVHLLSEYSNCTAGNLGTYEHLPFYTPDGLFDLEDRLLRNNSIHMSDAAITLFYQAMKRLNEGDFGWFGGYKRRFGSRFMEMVDKFTDTLTQFTIKGYWSFDFDYKRTFRGIAKDTVKGMIGKQIFRFGYESIVAGDGMVRYSFVTEEEFFKAAREFVGDYIEMISDHEYKSMICDQLLLPHNLFRIDHYFRESEIKVLLLDRDPRDMFVLSKYIWPKMGAAVLFPDTAEEFIRFYTRLKSCEIKKHSDNILRLHFEDLVYKYEETVSVIEKFLGRDIGEHVTARTRFDPEVSIKNTQNFRIKTDWEEEVKPIEAAMREYLYKFPYYIKPSIHETSDPQ